MARTITCPHCQMRGSIPDAAKASRIRCRHCGEIFAAGAAGVAGSDVSRSSKPRPGNASGATRSVAISTAPIADQASPAPRVGSASSSGNWRPAGASKSTRRADPMVLTGLVGMSGVALFVFIALSVIFLNDDWEPDLADPDFGPSRPIAASRNRSGSPASRVASTEKVSPSGSAATKSAAPEPESKSGTEPSPAAAITTASNPEDLARALKDSTVYLKIKAAGKVLSTGSAFVIGVQGDAVRLVTNRHLAVFDLTEIPPSAAPPGSKPEVEAVFRSGQGAGREQALTASLLAADFSDDVLTDLAFLQVKGVREPPRPVDFAGPFEPTDGAPCLGTGFPLGGVLYDGAQGGANPSASVVEAKVAAQHRDGAGRILMIEIDPPLPPGASGGPIVDQKSGRLIGVTAAKPGAVDPIASAVPVDELRRALAGRVGAVELTLRKNDPGGAEIEVHAQVVDPDRKIAGVAVHVASAATAAAPKTLPDGSWEPIAKTKEVELKHDPAAAAAVGTVKVVLTGSGPDSRKVLVQTGRKLAQGGYAFDKPRVVALPEKVGKVLPPGRLDHLLRTAQPKSFNLLGPLLENSKDCQLVKDEPSLTIRIDMPGKLFTLAPELAHRNVPLHNAPITLAEVEGDFAAFVELGGGVDPGTKPLKDPRGGRFPFTVQSRGLILYQDVDNFLRFERAATVAARSTEPVDRLMVEFVLKGRHAIPALYRDVPDPRTLLILVKDKQRLRCFYSTDEGRTTTLMREFEIELPDRVLLGLSASNISAKPFSAVFEKFAILSGDVKIDRLLSE